MARGLLIDVICTHCDYKKLDVWVVDKQYPDCEQCGSLTVRMYETALGGVIDDSIPGGLEIRHGLCHPDGSPRRYDSKTEIRREEKKRGWENHVEHIGAKGSDKNKHTTRWT